MNATLFRPEPPTRIRVLSLWQPWASFMAHGLKLIESRDFVTHIREEVGVYATKTEPPETVNLFWHRETSEYFCRAIESIFGAEKGSLDFEQIRSCFKELPRGKVLSIHDLIDCQAYENLSLTDQERALGNYGRGRFGWEMPVIERFPEPIPLDRGGQLWKWWERPTC